MILKENKIQTKSYFIETYGCQMNVYDSELVASFLEKSGYQSTSDYNSADVIFLNTCSIRDNAENTVHRKLENLAYLKKQNPKMMIGVLGCMAQNLKNELMESKPYVDVILGPDSYRKIPEILESRNKTNNHFVDTKLSKFEIYEDLFPTRKSGVNAWVSIMRGCDKFCTFCIVPFTRGRERSRTIDSIVKEVEACIEQGFIEITLLGQNVNSFRTPDGEFPELLDAVSKVKGLKRLRYTSPHPRDIDDHLLNVMKKNKNICNHIHLPLQAGSDRILKRMNRTYSKKEFLDLVIKIKKYLPDCSITTDIIVGFPGETEEEFSDTLDVAEKVIFDNSFMFKYSPRPGTKAAGYTDQVDEEVKQNRLERYIALQKILTLKNNKLKIGKTFEVLVEKESKKSANQWAGRLDGNMWVVFDKTNEKIKDLVKVRILDTKGITLFGERV
ncbi:MAG: tRNA (N6-isopentenyl adenosine(37)-C2)-methylthiotransferase MiaB [Candidatus Marinimicrobia bacterium]|nr:tRNA (N6-isopentenyl adenosine(37)-C2)-methylthiotransferase MiaB [Candidatus Neomarinimicrobiota bacterium]|tara:strand:- start:1281 stop:2609 length:1329 start_codon:yes stop_codon:yes gene_type:complete